MAGRRKTRRRSGSSRGVQRGKSSVYQFTPKRKAQLKRAQAISARKRSALAKHVTQHRAKYIVASATAITAGGIVARHKLSGSSFAGKTGPNVSVVTGKSLGRGLSATIQHGGVRGATITARTKARKGVFTYDHKKLEVGDYLGTKISTTIRGVRTGFSSNPAAPGYDSSRNSNYGSHGPRMTDVDQLRPRKYVGNYEMFSNMGEEEPKKYITDISEAMAGSPRPLKRH